MTTSELIYEAVTPAGATKPERVVLRKFSRNSTPHKRLARNQLRYKPGVGLFDSEGRQVWDAKEWAAKVAWGNLHQRIYGFITTLAERGDFDALEMILGPRMLASINQVEWPRQAELLEAAELYW